MENGQEVVTLQPLLLHWAQALTTSKPSSHRGCTGCLTGTTSQYKQLEVRSVHIKACNAAGLECGITGNLKLCLVHVQESGEEQGLPVQGTCPTCSKGHSWMDILAKSESVPWRQKRYGNNNISRQAVALHQALQLAQLVDIIPDHFLPCA